MSFKTHAARCLCLVLAGGVARAADAAAVPKGNPDQAAAAVLPQPMRAPEGGFVLDRLSKRDLRVWRAIERVVGESDVSGGPRSPALRRLWDWARASNHVLRVEMVPPSRLAAGMVGVFRVESFDPAGLRHVAVIRLCPTNIQRAKATSAPDAVRVFTRFEGLTEAERYAEVLAHELAHAEYVLESPERLAELQAAQDAIEQAFSRSGRARIPVPEERVRRSEKPLAVLAASEAHAESVESIVLRELAGRGPAPRTSGSLR
jgi:hypothetical protein